MKQKKEAYSPDFIQIPYKLVMDRNFSWADKFTYGAILFFSKNKYKICFESNSEIASLILSTARSVANSLTKLEKAGYIKRDFVSRIDGGRQRVIFLL